MRSPYDAIAFGWSSNFTYNGSCRYMRASIAAQEFPLIYGKVEL
jgi:hypothetical protein